MSLMVTFGNILIILSVTLNKKLQVISNVFIVNLAIADLSVTTVIEPFIAIGLFDDVKFFEKFPIVCIFLGFLIVVSCGCSIWSIVAISVERYFHICHSNLFGNIITLKWIPLIVMCPWIIAVVIAVPYLEYFHWGIYEYLFVERVCSWTYEENYFYTFYLMGLGLFVPMIIIPYCYFQIYLFVKKSKQRMSKHRPAGTNSTKWKEPDTQILITVAVIWVCFTVMWAPYGIYRLFIIYDNFPEWYPQTATVLCLGNSSINFIIYGIMNKNFRRSYSMIYYKVIFGKIGRQLRKSEGSFGTNGNRVITQASSVVLSTLNRNI